jgi:hypothetical protein
VPSGSLTSEQVLAILAETPRRLAALTAGLEPAQLRAGPGPEAWSANDVLAHLRACADVWGGCIARMLAEDRPAFPAVSPRTWINRTDYRELELFASLHSFTAQRADLMAVLVPLPGEDWLRAATVTTVGRVLEPTVLSYAERLARHEREHVRQIEQIVTAMRG